jgi:hypothetical protein
VEIVIPTRERCALLREAVASIQRQTLGDWGLVIVDDASTDGTREWLTSLANRDERVQTVRLESHSERATARNCGLELVTSPFVLFLDDDDRLTPRALEGLVNALTVHPDAVEAIGARIAFDKDGHRRRAHHVRLRMTRRVWPDMLAGWFAVPGQCLFRTETLLTAGGWSEQIAGPEDQELQLRLSKLGPAVFVPASVLEYRVHPGQWRAHDAGVVEEAIHQDFVDALMGSESQRGVRLRLAHKILSDDADAARREGQYSEALAGYFRALRSAPEIVASPLTGPPLLALIGKAFAGLLLGSRLAPVVRNSLGAGRRLLRREPGGGAAKAVRSSSSRRD